jgi:hypothetical protein
LTGSRKIAGSRRVETCVEMRRVYWGWYARLTMLSITPR